ncbi:hypothetical protein [Scytonema sp. PRP1]|uniref:hypothetical protein n=1 Tax=Scytonema sp. PRP1 TaxID=3120513 RepID=UPI002FD541F1
MHNSSFNRPPTVPQLPYKFHSLGLGAKCQVADFATGSNGSMISHCLSFIPFLYKDALNQPGSAAGFVCLPALLVR